MTGGSVSERPKERASKAREGSRPPWVQIPPLPPSTRDKQRTSPTGRSAGVLLSGSQLQAWELGRLSCRLPHPSSGPPSKPCRSSKHAEMACSQSRSAPGPEREPETAGASACRRDGAWRSRLRGSGQLGQSLLLAGVLWSGEQQPTPRVTQVFAEPLRRPAPPPHQQQVVLRRRHAPDDVGHLFIG